MDGSTKRQRLLFVVGNGPRRQGLHRLFGSWWCRSSPTRSTSGFRPASTSPRQWCGTDGGFWQEVSSGSVDAAKAAEPSGSRNRCPSTVGAAKQDWRRRGEGRAILEASPIARRRGSPRMPTRHKTFTARPRWTCWRSAQGRPIGWLNVAHNCVDRHVEAGNGDRVATRWEGEPVGDSREVTYSDLLTEVCKAANALTGLGPGHK